MNLWKKNSYMHKYVKSRIVNTAYIKISSTIFEKQKQKTNKQTKKQCVLPNKPITEYFNNTQDIFVRGVIKLFPIVTKANLY